MAKKYKYAPPEECSQCVIMARVSSREQAQGASIDAQLEMIRDYSRKHNFTIIKEYHVVESSTNGERKRFYEMLEYVKQQKSKTSLIVHCIDRMQRGYKECVEIEQLLKEDKIEVHFYKEGFYLHKESSSSDMARYDMGVLSAKMYIGSMRDNVKRSLNYNWSQGKWQGLSPLGYINIKNDEGKADIALDPERSDIIKTLFELYATTNHSIKSLTEYAKELGLVARKTIKKRKTNYITHTGIYHALQNPFYYGLMRVKGKLIPHIHPKLIDKALFDKVQDKLHGNNGVYRRNLYSSIPFAFRGLIRCSTCGCMITQETHIKKSGKQYTYLRCSHKKRPCKQKIVNENTIFKQLNEEIFNNLKIYPSEIGTLKKNTRQYLNNISDINTTHKRDITNNINTLTAKGERLFDFYLEGNIDKTTYEAKKSEIEEENEKLQKTYDNYIEINEDLKQTIDSVLDLAANVPMYMKTSNPNQQRELLGILLTNCHLEGQKLTYTLQKPFNNLLKNPNCEDWLDIQPNDLEYYSTLTNKIDQFMKNISI